MTPLMHDTAISNVRDATDATLHDLIVRSDVPTLVDFWAPWCGPCRLLAPVLDRVALDYRGRVHVLRVNVDDNPSASASYDIRSIPTLILFDGGVPSARIMGAVPLAQLAVFLETALAQGETIAGS